MSCQLSLYAQFHDVRSVKRFLFPDSPDNPRGGVHDHSLATDAVEGWDDFDWGWKDDGVEAETEEKEVDQLSWLQESQVSLSPSGDLIALSNVSRIVLLAQKWDSNEEVQMKYSNVFEGSLAQEEGEKITCILCLPLASQKRSTHGGPDWTCVVVGFSSGYVRMYTETGTLLLSQIFSEESVINLKCTTYAPPSHCADAEKHEELGILYGRSLVTIDGFSLFQSLKACRNQVARATASGSELLPPPPLAYKKWAFAEQEQVVNHVSCGLVPSNPFDQLRSRTMNSSLYGSSSVNASHLYMTVGTGPYVGFFYTAQGGTQPLLSDVAHAVANKLKSALFSQISSASGWFGLGRHQTDNTRDRKKPKIEPATSLSSRFGLYDKRRVGTSIILSPECRMALTTDSFGRVILVDVLRAVAVRMWKGYRDAQVGWVSVTEDILQDAESSSQHKDVRRRALFIVIYAPRRGLLEVWAAQHGPRVAAFSVSKWCRLICPDYGLMGLNNVTCRNFISLTHNVYLIDPDGSVKSIEIPFHLALSDKSNKRIRDMHLLKQVKLLLKDQTVENDGLKCKVVETLLDIKIPSIRQQGLERVLNTRYLSVDFIQHVIEAVAKQLQSMIPNCVETEAEAANGETLDYESRALLQFCQSNILLLTTYQQLSMLNSAQRQPAETSSEDSIKKTLVQVLSVSDEEAVELIELIDKYTEVTTQPSKPRAHFACDLPSNLTVVEFLSGFECCPVKQESEDGTSSHCELVACIRSSISETKRTKLAGFLFNSFLAATCSKSCDEFLRNSRIPAEDLMRLLLHLWLSENRHSLSSVDQLHSLVSCINSLRITATGDVRQSGSWWHLYKDACCQSQHVTSALIMALIGRSIVLAESTQTSLSVESETNHSSTGDLSSWEPITLDHEQWTALVKQLEDLLSVQCLLDSRPGPGSTLTKPPWDPESLSICLKQVLDGGRGVIPEFVAKWISGHGIPPSFLCLESTIEEAADGSGVTIADSSENGKRTKWFKSRSLSLSGNPIVRQLQDIQTRLPLTLSVDILMANCAWEFMVIWNRDPETIFALEQAVVYLKCIQNAVILHGLAAMIWQMFIVKKLSVSVFLVEKVGKAPKDRLCRKDVGLSEVSLEKFMACAVDLLETIYHARQDSQEVPVFLVEDLWQSVQGPTSLVELAVEQKETNAELVEHHYLMCAILHAILFFSMKTVKPLSLFDTKGRNAFFNPLHTVPLLSYDVYDDAIIQARQKFLCRVITHAAIAAYSSTAPSSNFSKWPALVMKLAGPLHVDADVLARHHVLELYSSGQDKLAQEVLSTVNCHAVMGTELMEIVGCRLAHFIFNCDTPGTLDKLAKCSPSVSKWLKSLDLSQVRCPNPPLSATTQLMGHVINLLPESQTEYSMALELVELMQSIQ